MDRVEHDLTGEQWAALVAAWSGCAYCGETAQSLQRDRVLAISRGGRYVAHRSCATPSAAAAALIAMVEADAHRQRFAAASTAHAAAMAGMAARVRAAWIAAAVVLLLVLVAVVVSGASR